MNANSGQNKQTWCWNETQKQVSKDSLMYPLSLKRLTVPPVVVLTCKVENAKRWIVHPLTGNVSWV